MKKVIMNDISNDDMSKTFHKVEDIISDYYYCYDKSRTVIFDKIWHHFKPSTTDITFYRPHDYSYNTYDEYICIYPISFSSFVILVKEDNKINTIFKVYNIIDDHYPIIKKYVIKDDTIFEFPAISPGHICFDEFFYNDLLLRTEFNEAKVADEISDMTGYDFRYPVDKLKSNWTLYSSYPEHYCSYYDIRRCKNLVKNKNVYLFSNSNYSFYIVKVNKNKGITRISYIEREFIEKEDGWDYVEHTSRIYTIYRFKVTDYYINSYDRFYVDFNKYTSNDFHELNGFFIDTLNNAIMNTRRDYKLEQDVRDTISFINKIGNGNKKRYFDELLHINYKPALEEYNYFPLIIFILPLFLAIMGYCIFLKITGVE